MREVEAADGVTEDAVEVEGVVALLADDVAASGEDGRAGSDGDGEDVTMNPETMRIPPPPTHRLHATSKGGSDAAELPAVPKEFQELGDMEPLSAEEVAEFAEYLGMTPGEDSRYLWIAEQALCAPLPEGWREMEDHLGNTFYLLTDEVGEVHTAWEHPHDEFYRELFANLKARKWDLITRNEVLEMAEFLGLDPVKHASLMWIPQQAAVAPLPAGWQEQTDEKGVFYVNDSSGFTSRAHPLDVVFQTAASVEKGRLEGNIFSLPRVAALGEASGAGPSLGMRLAEEDGSSAYTYDWLQGRRVADTPDAASPFSAVHRQHSVAGGNEMTPSPAGLTIKTSSPPRRLLSARSASGELDFAERNLSAELAQEAALVDTGGSPRSPEFAAANVSPSALLAQRVPLVSRQSGMGTPKAAGKAGGRSRFATTPRPTRKRATQPRVRPFEHYPTGLPATRKPEGWAMLNPAAVWVWGAYYLWAWALVLPGVRRVLPKPPER